MNNRFKPGWVLQNYRALSAHGIHPQGSYQDVFGYTPPDKDFNPEHPNTRTDSMTYRASVFRWIRNNLGIVGTEAGSDWVIPYVDYVASRQNPRTAASIPIMTRCRFRCMSWCITTR